MSTAPPSRVRAISSRQNSLVKELRRAFAQGGALDDSICAIESLHIVEEAARSGVSFRAIFLTPAQAHRAEELLSIVHNDPEVLLVAGDVFNSAVATQAPQGVAALVHPPDWELPSLLRAVNPFLLCAAGLQDPGNLGTMIRSAEAFGAAGILLMPGTVNIWNAKTVRSSAGSVFRLPHAKLAWEDIPALRQAGIRLLATSSRKGIPLWESDLKHPCVVFVGNEGAGLPEELVDLTDQTITIPQERVIESINAAVAASIVGYEASRQRGS